MRRLIPFFFVACAQEKAPPAIHREPVVVIEASAPVASVSASASVAVEAPPAPALCRRAITQGTPVRNADIAALVVDGSPGPKHARDCRGDGVDYQNRTATTVIRGDARDDRLAVFVKLAKEPGYFESCPGFVALVHIEPDAITAEGVSAVTLQECDDPSMKPRLAKLDGTFALLLPDNTGTGESGDADGVWRVSIPDSGALRDVGSVLRFISAGNGTMSSGLWLGTVDTNLLAGDGLKVEEKWVFVRYGANGEEQGKRLTRVRTYALQSGKLVASPKNDPTQ